MGLVGVLSSEEAFLFSFLSVRVQECQLAKLELLVLQGWTRPRCRALWVTAEGSV
jgi:hypothetical protein